MKDYQAKYNAPLSSFGGHAWDALYLVANALKVAGCDKEGIRNELEKTTNFVGQHGVFNFSPWQDAFYMTVVKNNDFTLAD